MTNTLHAHFSIDSSDCDGSYSRSYVMVMEESTKDFADILFHERVVNSVVDTYALAHGARLDVDKNEDGTVTLEWFEPTDEGSKHTTAVICEKDCEAEVARFRDHRAESMGY